LNLYIWSLLYGINLFAVANSFVSIIHKVERIERVERTERVEKQLLIIPTYDNIINSYAGYIVTEAT
jgi:hypothetical protein